ALLPEKPPRNHARLFQQQGGPSETSRKVPKRFQKRATDGARAKNPLPNRAKIVRAPAARPKKEYRVDRRVQNHAKRREPGDGPHHRELLGNALAAAANAISWLTTKSGWEWRTRADLARVARSVLFLQLAAFRIRRLSSSGLLCFCPLGAYIGTIPQAKKL